MTWQPIATAPKDGTEIACYEPGDIYYAAFSDGLFRYEGASGNFQQVFNISPTHWRPLSAPPKGDTP